MNRPAKQDVRHDSSRPLSIAAPEMSLTLALIREAHARIKDKIHRTPVLSSATLNAQARAQLFFKCENFQKGGAFKARGATNAVFLLSEEQARHGVATHSSGNHAAALARAAALRGISAHIVMPNNAPQAKRAAVARYGGHIVFCEPTLAARESNCARLISETGATLIHPYDDVRVMAGQGTTALEFLETLPELDLLLCPVGGGGQLSGVAVAGKSLKPNIRIIGAEPAGADDAYRSFKAGHIIASVNPQTIADGLRSSLGQHTFPVIQRYVDEIVTVSEESIVRAMRTIWEVMKIIIEPSAAVPYAALLEDKLKSAGKRIGIILSGGNLDLETLPWMNPPA
jgi:threonine dehydratase